MFCCQKGLFGERTNAAFENDRKFFDVRKIDHFSAKTHPGRATGDNAAFTLNPTYVNNNERGQIIGQIETKTAEFLQIAQINQFRNGHQAENSNIETLGESVDKHTSICYINLCQLNLT